MLLENFKMAIESIKANKLRSFLTMLGIIIGISSVITIVALGQGGKNSITGEFEKIGAATVQITMDATKASKSDYMTLKDVKLINDRVDTIKYITPVLQRRGLASSEAKSKFCMMTGGNVDISNIQNVEILYGRFFNDREYEEGRPVAVIDEATAKYMFGYTDVVGKSLKIGSSSSIKNVTIIGVNKGYSGPFGGQSEDMPAFATVPATLLQTIFPNDLPIDSITLMAKSKDDTEIAGNSAKNVLENKHNNKGKNIYKADSLLKQLDQVNKVIGIFTTFIGAVAAISLLVGGIGVMNIMLVSVTERTKEIGIRKSIGATTKAIMLQFLTESVILSLIGGIIGIVLGIAGAEAIGLAANIVPSISPGVILFTILFSSAVGIFFGIYPAKKAAKLNPIDALRYE